MPAALARRAEAGGWLREGAALLRIAARETRPAVERGAVLVNLAWLEHQLGHDGAAEAAAEAGVAALRADDEDPSALVDGLFVLGSLARHRGDDAAARAWWTEASARVGGALGTKVGGAPRGARDVGHAALHLALGQVEDALQDATAAFDHYLAAIRAARPVVDDHVAATAQNNLGHELLARGRTDEAGVLLGRAMTLARGLADRQLEAHVLEGLAQVAVASGDAHRARHLASRAVELGRELGDPGLEAEALTTLASAWGALGDVEAAVAVARAALRAAASRGNAPGVARAALELATSLGSAHPQAGPLLDALASDPAVPIRLREAAATVRGGEPTPQALPTTLEAAVRVTLG